MKLEKLDNPTWYALTETHKECALDYDGIKFYHPAYCPFGGFINLNSTQAAMDKYACLTNNFYVIGDQPLFNDTVQLKMELICNQMVLEQKINLPITETIIALQTATQKTALFDLVTLVQPGYFKGKTADLGNYYGIYKDNKLVSAAGERMKMNEYTEVSAVVTHPNHLGKGYAKQLVAYACKNIANEGKIPYLHVTETNFGAIQLYEKLGFKTRRKISFWNFVVDVNVI
jgi:GNAT superfamily N-acetyltransferase